ncbi:MAG TPA: S1 domain-containing post-transcriptional regulator GSP13 [Bacillota bacterium]|nr:S1 domain-containing post-transcriptional regulator GSP13 [Bacillota bacterium]
MTKEFEVGQVVDGKVAGLQPYGAFVAINDNIQGLVHISEVTNGFVKDINDHLTVGDDVTVKILKIDEENNKYSLSIRATEDAPQKHVKHKRNSSVSTRESNDPGFNTLKEKLQEWMEHFEAK